MARPQVYCNLALISKKDLVRDILKALIDSNNTSILIFAVFYTVIPTFTLSYLSIYIDVNLYKVTKLAIKLFIWGQKYSSFYANFAFGIKFLRLKTLNLYYKSLHIEYYNFYWQYKNYFNIAGITQPKCIFFAVLFFCNRINFY